MKKGLMAIGALLLGTCMPHLLNAAVAVRTYQWQNVREATPASEQSRAAEGAVPVEVALVPAFEYPSDTQVMLCGLTFGVPGSGTRRAIDKALAQALGADALVRTTFCSSIQ